MANPTILNLLSVNADGKMLVVSPEGKVLKKFEDPKGKVLNHITGGKVIGDFIYFTTFKNDFIGRLKL
jgi:sugar lactone lactonase YvrE